MQATYSLKRTDRPCKQLLIVTVYMGDKHNHLGSKINYSIYNTKTQLTMAVTNTQAETNNLNIYPSPSYS